MISLGLVIVSLNPLKSSHPFRHVGSKQDDAIRNIIVLILLDRVIHLDPRKGRYGDKLEY